MNLIEAKQFEYSIRTLQEIYSNNDKVKNKDLTYKIVWSHKDHLFFCETFKTKNHRPIILEKNTPYGQPVLAEFGKEQTNIFWKIRDQIFDKFHRKNDPFFDEHLIYEQPEKLMNVIIEDIELVEESTEPIERSTIYNVSDLFSDESLDFLKVSDNFEIKPVSLIKIQETD